MFTKIFEKIDKKDEDSILTAHKKLPQYEALSKQLEMTVSLLDAFTPYPQIPRGIPQEEKVVLRIKKNIDQQGKCRAKQLTSQEKADIAIAEINKCLGVASQFFQPDPSFTQKLAMRVILQFLVTSDADSRVVQILRAKYQYTASETWRFYYEELQKQSMNRRDESGRELCLVLREAVIAARGLIDQEERASAQAMQT